MLVVRERYKRVVSIYDEVQSKVSEEVWEATYSAKMVDDSETKQATVFAAARKAVEEHEARQERPGQLEAHLRNGNLRRVSLRRKRHRRI